jgi:ketosteroid isomerase-like protein
MRGSRSRRCRRKTWRSSSGPSGTSSEPASLSGTQSIQTVEVYDHDISDAGTYRGHADYLKWLADWNAAWRGSSVEPERWIDAGDKVVVVFQMTAKGRGSGVEVNRRDAMVLAMRDGKQVRLDYYNSESQALEAVGLSE